MKLFILIFTAFIIAVFFIFGNIKTKQNTELQNKYKGFKIIDYQIENKNYKLLVADTPAKWEKGLMYFRSLEGVDGMIFLMNSREIQSFWNKNTFMDLELIWIDGDKVVGKSKLPSIEKSKEIVTVNSPAPADKVIEITSVD